MLLPSLTGIGPGNRKSFKSLLKKRFLVTYDFLQNLWDGFLLTGLRSIRKGSSTVWVLRAGGSRVGANLTKGFIYKLSIEDASSGAASPGSGPAVLTLRGKCSHFRAKPAHLVSHLPPV